MKTKKFMRKAPISIGIQFTGDNGEEICRRYHSYIQGFPAFIMEVTDGHGELAYYPRGYTQDQWRFFLDPGDWILETEGRLEVRSEDQLKEEYREV